MQSSVTRALVILVVFAAVCLLVAVAVMDSAGSPLRFEASGSVWIVSLALSAASALGVIAGAAISVRTTGWSAANVALLLLGVVLVALGRFLYGYETRPF